MAYIACLLVLLYNITVKEAPESYEAVIEEAERIVPQALREAEIANLAFKYQIVREGDGRLMVYKGPLKMGTTDEFVTSYAMTVVAKYGDAATAHEKKSFSVVRLAALPEWIKRCTPRDNDSLNRAA